MADVIKPLTTVQMAMVLANEQRKKEEASQGQLIPAGTDDNPQQPSLGEKFFQMIEVQTGYLESISADIELLVTQFDEFITAQGLARLKDLEDKREEAPAIPNLPEQEEQSGGFLKKIREWIGKFQTGFILGLTAFLSALTLSNFGFTGFEGNLLNSIKNSKFLTNLKNATGGVFDKIKNIFTTFKTFITDKFPKFDLEKIKTTISKVVDPVADFFRSVGGRITGFLRVVGKFLAPLAIAMSAFDGFGQAKEAAEEGEGAFTVIGEFIKGFIGSFIGEFANLIKTILLFPFKALGIGVGEDGNFDTSSLVGSFLSKIETLNFNELIQNFIQGVFDIFDGVYNGIRDIGRSLGLVDTTAEDVDRDIAGKRESLDKIENNLDSKKKQRQGYIDAGLMVPPILEQEIESIETRREKTKASITEMRRSPVPRNAVASETLAAETQTNRENSGGAGGLAVVTNSSSTNIDNSSNSTAMIESPSAIDGLTLSVT